MTDEHPTNQFPAYGSTPAWSVPPQGPGAVSPTPSGATPPSGVPANPSGPGPAGLGGFGGPGGPAGNGGTGGPGGPGGPEGPDGSGTGPAGGPPRSRRVALAVAAAVVVVLGAGIGVAVAVGTDDNSSAKGAPASTAAGSSGAGAQQGRKNGKKGKNAIRGTITAESGSTWTVKTVKGETVKVTITSDTKFGSAKDKAQQSDFPVGKSVAVVPTPGTAGKSTITAVRVRVPVPKAGGKQGKRNGGNKGSSSTPAPSSSPS